MKYVTIFYGFHEFGSIFYGFRKFGRVFYGFYEFGRVFYGFCKFGRVFYGFREFVKSTSDHFRNFRFLIFRKNKFSKFLKGCILQHLKKYFYRFKIRLGKF